MGLLETVNASLPEQNPVPIAHPEYLADGNEMDIRLTSTADVWVTFVHEGAGWKNSLAFYTYDVNTPPQTVDDIGSISIVFPNVSYAGSGGDLASGHRVHIGTFPGGTGIGWALIANGWTGSGVGTGSHIVYSEPDFNPEANPALRQHSVLLRDPLRNILLLGFEDMRRDSGSDDDFNDAIFYVTANPYEAIETTEVVEVDSSPTEPDQSTVGGLYYPSATSYSTLAFEDLWPGKGDYDFNDLVVDLQFELATNTEGRVTRITGTFFVKAVGAGFRNGFGFEMPFAPSMVARVEGTRTSGSYIQTSSNGLEAGQSKAVVVVFDDAYDVIDRPAGYFVNTQRDAPFVQPTRIDVQIFLARPMDLSEVGLPPFNPFLIANGDRGKEIHLPDRFPTSKASPDLFGQSNDDSRPGSGRYYKTHDNLPWAIHLPVSFEYPIENHSILTAHVEFGRWAESSGSVSSDWYLDKPAYRNTLSVY